MAKTSWKLVFEDVTYSGMKGFFFKNAGDPPTYSGTTNEQVWKEIQELRRKLYDAECALIAVKHAKINVPPEKSFGDWTEKKINSLKEAQDYAAQELEKLRA